MKKLLGLLSLILLASCDAPQRTRTPQDYMTSNSYTNTDGSTGYYPTTTGTAAGGTTGGPVPGVAGFETCDLTMKYYAAGIGYMGVCQSTLNETMVEVKPSVTNTLVRTCLIPTYKEANGSSTYLGQPQCFYTTANQMVSGTLYKTRVGFTAYTLNGMMVMQETSLTAYFACMDAYANYRSGSCPSGAQTNVLCNQAAASYRDQLCNTFKTMTSYIDIQLK